MGLGEGEVEGGKYNTLLFEPEFCNEDLVLSVWLFDTVELYGDGLEEGKYNAEPEFGGAEIHCVWLLDIAELYGDGVEGGK